MTRFMVRKKMMLVGYKLCYYLQWMCTNTFDGPSLNNISVHAQMGFLCKRNYNKWQGEKLHITLHFN